jgi:hypothetical protein
MCPKHWNKLIYFRVNGLKCKTAKKRRIDKEERGSRVVKALCYKPEGRGFEIQ